MPKTAYEMRISDWSSDVCSSDLEIVMGRGIDIGDVTIERADQALQLEFRLVHQPGVDLGLDLESGALPVELAEPDADADREADERQDQDISRTDEFAQDPRPVRSGPRVGALHENRSVPIGRASCRERVCQDV